MVNANKPFDVSEGRETEIVINEIAVLKQLIKELSSPLELLRELISNAAAREVGAKEIRIVHYVHPEYGNVFEVTDDGCGMDLSNNYANPGRLDRFLGLGFSGIVGLEADEFSWKGLGSKLAFRSKRIELKTWQGRGNVLSVVVEDSWKDIELNKKPTPMIYEAQPKSGEKKGTTITVYGYPPHSRGDDFAFEDIKDYLCHRTFIGYTRNREGSPRIKLSVLGHSEEIEFGFPEIKYLEETPPDDTVIVPPLETEVYVKDKDNELKIVIRGFYSWDNTRFGLGESDYNNGLIVSVKGIPYFAWNLRDIGSGQLGVARPGNNNCCLIAECDGVNDEMNIGRTDLVDSETKDKFLEGVLELIRKIEGAENQTKFLQYHGIEKGKETAKVIEKAQQDIGQTTEWVYVRDDKGNVQRLGRVPKNEPETLLVLWKLEAIGALPFKRFETLCHLGQKGPDLLVHFQEDDQTAPEVPAVVEVERVFWNYTYHGHSTGLHPTVVCWERGSKPKIRMEKTKKHYKHFAIAGDERVRIYSIKDFENVYVGDENGQPID